MFTKARTDAMGWVKRLMVTGIAAKLLSSDEKEERSRSGWLGKAALGGVLGAVAFYFLDPRMGKTRRAKVRDKAVKLVNRTSDKADKTQRYVASQAEGLSRRATAAVTPDAPPPSDEALQDKIESEVLSRHNYPKGQVTLEVVDSIVTIRGQLDTAEEIAGLEQDVRKVSGVVEVNNLLHLPGQPPPNKAASLEAGR